jgi:hypothetical protein
MKYLLTIIACVTAIAWFYQSRANAAHCMGNDCLSITSVRTRCGKATSVEVDVRNESDQNLRGYVVFETPKGT